MAEEKIEREIPKEFTQGYKRTVTPKTCGKCGSSNIMHVQGNVWKCLACGNIWTE